MRIDTIRIRNFRCYYEKEGEKWGTIFRPNKYFNLIVGPNGAGKTAILDSLDLVLNAENRSNQSLITEYDFPNCDTSKSLYIEVTLTDLGQARGIFESDLQWIDPTDGCLVEDKEIEPDIHNHREAVVIALEAYMDQHSGAIEWRWLLPKFQATSLEGTKELSRSQHQSLGYFRIRPMISAGAFTLGQYSALGRHLRKLQYRLGKLPESLNVRTSLPTCSLNEPQCSTCLSRHDCVPDKGENDSDYNDTSPTIGMVLKNIILGARKVLSSSEWDSMQPHLGPRYGGLSSALAALTLGIRTYTESNPSFIPFDRLSSGEKYALSFSLAKAQIPGERPPVIVMEEPETALYPTAVSTLLRDIQSQPTGEIPQIIASSHSEAVLRCFLPSDIFILERGQDPTKLVEIIKSVKPTKRGPFHNPEYLIMTGGPSVLFADKILVVEGAHDVIVSGYLDHLAAKITATSSTSYVSFSALGWCVFSAGKADEIPDCIRVLKALGKKAAALFDGDDPGLRNAEMTKDICPTFVFNKTTSYQDPQLEEALLEGLSEDARKQALQELDSCLSCELNSRTRCWFKKGECSKGSRDDRKILIQNICLKLYEKNSLFPHAFKNLLSKLDTATEGVIHGLDLDK